MAETSVLPKEVADSVFKETLVKLPKVPVQHPMGEITKKIEMKTNSFPSMPLIPSFSWKNNSYTLPYSLIGSVLGTGYGFWLMKMASKRKFITDKWEEEENYGYLFWGGVVGLCFGKMTGNLINML